jgi:glycosyltransferase involved in cell wall biosynthesis
MNYSITIFTPTYNRAYTLNLCYESLKRQTSNDFLWLIIDDGSNDNTRELVEQWIQEGLVPIRYIYQENQGMHGAHNTAYKNINTELNVCIDSDDYMPDDAIEKIITFWRSYGNENYAGLVGLDATRKGNIIGTLLPEYTKYATLTDIYGKYNVKGDKKLVYRTDLIKKIPPYPIFAGEKYCPLSYKYILIDQECPLLLLNEVLCHVEYLEDGSSRNIINQYKKNPKGFSFFRKITMIYSTTNKERFRAAIHYVSSNLMLKNTGFLKETPCKLHTLLAIPLGFLLYVFITNNHRLSFFKSMKDN